MIRALHAVRGFAGTLWGRLTLILTVGMSVAAILALLVAEDARRHDFGHFRNQRLVVSVADLATRLARDPVGTRRMLAEDKIIGAHRVGLPVLPGQPDPSLDAALRATLGADAHPSGRQVSVTYCFREWPSRFQRRAAGFLVEAMPECWLVGYDDAAGHRVTLAFDLPPVILPPSTTLNPLFLLLIVVASAALSLLGARLATAPLRRLTRATQAFAQSIDAESIAETGPSDVRATLAAFNVMQQRVRNGVSERTQMLAAIGHDLQTPLTRLRLRLEQVQDTGLRERLITDLTATLTLIRGGLDLARSHESREDWSVVDIDSLLSSVAEDAAEFGDDVRFTGGCGAQVRVKPDALLRCLTNLVDNAVKYGGGAELASRGEQGQLAIIVTDRGPGIPEDQVARMLEPFVRGTAPDGRATGTGIGLTIAKAQAETFGGRLNLANRDQGGLQAIVRIPINPS